MPACKGMVKIVLGPEVASKISQVPTLADTVGCKVSDISCDNEVIWEGVKLISGGNSPIRLMSLLILVFTLRLIAEF